MAPVPNYAATPVIHTVRITTANTARDGGTGTVDVFTASSVSSSGVNVYRIYGKATGTLSSASQVVVYLYNPGTLSYDLRAEFTVAAATPSAQVATGEGSIIFPVLASGIAGLSIPGTAGWKLALSATNVPSGGAIVCTVESATYA